MKWDLEKMVREGVVDMVDTYIYLHDHDHDHHRLYSPTGWSVTISLLFCHATAEISSRFAEHLASLSTQR